MRARDHWDGVSLALTGIAVVILVIGNQQSIVLAGSGLVDEVLVLNLSKLDHFCGVGKGEGLILMNVQEMDDGRSASWDPTFLPGKSGEEAWTRPDALHWL